MFESDDSALCIESASVKFEMFDIVSIHIVFCCCYRGCVDYCHHHS